MSTSLTPVETLENDRKILTGLSERLIVLLKDGAMAEAKLAIAADEGLLSEARQALPALRRHATRQAGVEGVKAVIGRRFEKYPQPQRSEAGWSAWWYDWTDALEDLPASALEAGMRAWIKTSKTGFLPEPAELRALARATTNPAVTAYERAYFALQEAADAPRVERALDVPRAFIKPIPTENDRERVRRMAVEFTADQLARKPAPAPMKPIHGALAEGHHVTPQLLALLASQEIAA